MMKFFVALILVVCCVLQYTQGQARFQANARNPAYPGQCYDSATKTAIKKGFTKYTSNCFKMTCDNNYGLSVTGCGIAAAPKGCRVTRDFSKRHPDCCPKVVC